jgi:mRNA interferase RelE/StbE
MPMYEIRIGEDARQAFDNLPLPMQPRVLEVFQRLRHWPNVSGAKPLRGSLKGTYRIRSGDWRILFTVDVTTKRIIVFRIANRRDVYED